MFNLVSFPIILSLLVSLNPLAQSWSPCCRTHTHLDSYVRRNTNVHAEVDTSEPWLGFMVVGLRRGSRMSSTPQEGARDLGNQKERERERAKSKGERRTNDERRLDEESWWRGRAMKTQARDLEQRERDGNEELQKKGSDLSCSLSGYKNEDDWDKIQHIARSMWTPLFTHFCVLAWVCFAWFGFGPFAPNEGKSGRYSLQ